MRTKKTVVALGVALVVLVILTGCGPNQPGYTTVGPAAKGSVADENGMFIEEAPTISYEDNLDQRPSGGSESSGLDAGALALGALGGMIVNEMTRPKETIINERTIIKEKPVVVKKEKKKVASNPFNSYSKKKKRKTVSFKSFKKKKRRW